MSGFTPTPLDGSATPLPMSSAVPDGTNTPLAVEGGPSKSTGGNNLVPVAVYQYDGYNISIGTTTQTKATDGSTTSWSMIQLLKGIIDRFINGTIAVTGTFWQATQPVSTGADMTSSTAIAPNTATNTVIKASAGTLGSILVTTTSTGGLLIFDNASAASGKQIGLLPGSQPATGIPIVVNIPAANGITVKGAATSPGVTITWR